MQQRIFQAGFFRGRRFFKFFFFTSCCGYDIKRIPIKDILYFESSDHKILLHTSTAVDSFYDKIDNILSKVNPKTFIQIHKSIIVNKMHIKRFYYDSIELDNDETLPISQSRRKYVRLSILEE